MSHVSTKKIFIQIESAAEQQVSNFLILKIYIKAKPRRLIEGPTNALLNFLMFRFHITVISPSNTFFDLY